MKQLKLCSVTLKNEKVTKSPPKIRDILLHFNLCSVLESSGEQREETS